MAFSLKSKHRATRSNPAVISYKHLRRYIGYIALGLPVAVWLGLAIIGGHNLCPLDSISEYYYTLMRDVFVGALFMVGLFLIAYKGYNDWEDKVFNFCAFLSFAIALCGMNPVCYDSSCPACYNGGFPVIFNCLPLIKHVPVIGYIHLGTAATLFVILGYVSKNLFTRTYRDDDANADGPTAEKTRRNKLYRVCGWVIWVSLAVYLVYAIIEIAVFGWGKCEWMAKAPVLFTVEVVSLWAFGLSWLVKGEGVKRLNDKHAGE